MKMPATLLLFAVALTPFPLHAQSELQQARREVVEANRREMDAVMRGDAAGAAAIFLEDAVLLPPDGTLVRGRPAIREYWAPTPGTRITDAETTVERFDLRDDLGACPSNGVRPRRGVFGVFRVGKTTSRSRATARRRDDA